MRDPETAGEAKQKHDKADAHVVDQDPHGTRVYLFDLRTSALTPVAVAPDIAEAEWSHKSDRLAVVTNVMNNGDDLGPGNALWIVDVDHPAAPRRIASAPPTIGGVAWSTSDARLFFTAQAATDAPPGYGDLMALTLAGDAVTNLSRDFTGTVVGAPIAESDDAVLVPVANGTRGGYARFSVGGARPVPIALGIRRRRPPRDKRATNRLGVRPHGHGPADGDLLRQVARRCGPAARRAGDRRNGLARREGERRPLDE